MSHKALPCLAPALDNLLSSSPASAASRCAFSNSLSAAAVATSAAATTSATSGFCPTPSAFAASSARPALLPLSFFFFFLSLATCCPLPTPYAAGHIPFFVTWTVTGLCFSSATCRGSSKTRRALREELMDSVTEVAADRVVATPPEPPLRRAALFQPRAELAGVQPPGARGSVQPAASAARAGPLPVDLGQQPRRILHGPRRRPEGAPGARASRSSRSTG